MLDALSSEADINHLGEARLVDLRRELLASARTALKNQCRRQDVDIDEAEADRIARYAVEIGAVDVAEIYSPFRFSTRAQEFGLKPGFPFNLEEK